MSMNPFPDDLPRRTERALNLLASSGIRDFVAAIWDGELDPSIVHLIAPEWGLLQTLETELAGTLLYREVLGGGTLHDLCMGVIRDWAKAWGDVEGTYTLDPYQGLTFTSDNHDPAEEDPNPIHLHQFTSKISRDPAVWVEWATSDWAHHGFTDMTSWMVDSWVDEGGPLSAILQSGVEPGYLNDQMPAYEMDEEATSAALEHTWAQEDAGNEVTFEECEVSPHALLIRMIDDRSGRKTLEWLDGWRKTVPDLFPHLEGDLIRHAAVCAAVRSKTPSPSLS